MSKNGEGVHPWLPTEQLRERKYVLGTLQDLQSPVVEHELLYDLWDLPHVSSALVDDVPSSGPSPFPPSSKVPVLGPRTVRPQPCQTRPFKTGEKVSSTETLHYSRGSDLRTFLSVERTVLGPSTVHEGSQGESDCKKLIYEVTEILKH